MESGHAKSRIAVDLLPEIPAALHQQHRVVDALLGLPCWQLQYNGRPQVIAEHIIGALSNLYEVNGYASLRTCELNGD
jgi:hypothetical protein